MPHHKNRAQVVILRADIWQTTFLTSTLNTNNAMVEDLQLHVASTINQDGTAPSTKTYEHRDPRDTIHCPERSWSLPQFAENTTVTGKRIHSLCILVLIARSLDIDRPLNSGDSIDASTRIEECNQVHVPLHPDSIFLDTTTEVMTLLSFYANQSHDPCPERNGGNRLPQILEVLLGSPDKCRANRCRASGLWYGLYDAKYLYMYSRRSTLRLEHSGRSLI